MIMAKAEDHESSTVGSATDQQHGLEDSMYSPA